MILEGGGAINLFFYFNGFQLEFPVRRRESCLKVFAHSFVDGVNVNGWYLQGHRLLFGCCWGWFPFETGKWDFGGHLDLSSLRIRGHSARHGKPRREIGNNTTDHRQSIAVEEIVVKSRLTSVFYSRSWTYEKCIYIHSFTPSPSTSWFWLDGAA